MASRESSRTYGTDENDVQDNGSSVTMEMDLGMNSPAESRRNYIGQDSPAKRPRVYNDRDLHEAIINNDLAKFKFLIFEAGINVDAEVDGLYALHEAIRYQRVEMVKILLEQGAGVEYRAIDDGFSVLHFALDKLDQPEPVSDKVFHARMDEIVRLLAEHNADFYMEDAEDLTPMDHAIDSLEPDMPLDSVKTLLEWGVDPNSLYRANDPEFAGQTLLHRACGQQNIPLIQLLLNYEADLNAVDANGMTPLTYVLMRGPETNVELLRGLLGNDPDVNVIINHAPTAGYLVTDIAAKPGAGQVIQYMASRARDINKDYLRSFLQHPDFRQYFRRCIGEIKISTTTFLPGTQMTYYDLIFNVPRMYARRYVVYKLLVHWLNNLYVSATFPLYAPMILYKGRKARRYQLKLEYAAQVLCHCLPLKLPHCDDVYRRILIHCSPRDLERFVEYGKKNGYFDHPIGHEGA